MKLKLDESGHVVVKDGLPVYVHDNGSEVTNDAAANVAKIKSLADQLEEAKKEAKTLATKYAGIEDPDAARSALQVVANLDSKKLVDAGKVDELLKERSAAAEKAWSEKEKNYTTTIAEKESRIYRLSVGNKFATSKVFDPKKLAITPRMAEALWGNRFKVEGDDIVPYDEHGKKVYSSERPGELASFDEAIASFIAADPDRDRYTLGVNNGGGGSMSTQTTTNGSNVVLSRTQAQDPAAYRSAKAAAEKAGVPLQIAG